ncbi:MAG: DoxX family protein [Micropepsaceae bacterium]
MSTSVTESQSVRGFWSLWSHVTRLLEVITPLSFILLIGRIAVASVFLKSGLNKIESFEVAVQLFSQEYQVPILSPELAATLATTFELACSALLIVGLFTRLATLPLIGMVFVIQTFVYPQAWTDHLMWVTLLLMLLTRGPGKISLDAIFGKFVLLRKI